MAGNPRRVPHMDGRSLKVAIPRLPRAESSQTERQRVKQACEGCRKHKIRCSGQKPRCEHCSQSSQECVYTPARRDRLKIAEDHCDQMSTLLRDMRGNSSAEHGARIDELLQTSPNAPRALASSASDSQSPLRDTTPFDPDYMSICEPEVFDSSPVVTQPHSNYNRRVVVPEAEGRMGGTRVPTGRVHAAPTPDGRVNDPGGFHRQAALPWQAYSGDFTQTYEFPDNFPPNQLPPWQDTSHTFVTLAWMIILY